MIDSSPFQRASQDFDKIPVFTMTSERDTAIGGAASRFPSTRRTMIGSLRSDDPELRKRGFDTLISLYWKPLYKYSRIKWNRTNEDAKDLIQGFFTALLQKESLSGFDQGKGTFRTYLRTLFDRYASNEQKSASRIKRGGGSIQLDFPAAETELARHPGDTTLSADDYLHREFVRALFARVVARLDAECQESGKSGWFELFRAYDLESEGGLSYRELADRFSTTETRVTNRLAAMRRRFREIVLEELREVTASEMEFRAEAGRILGVGSDVAL